MRVFVFLICSLIISINLTASAPDFPIHEAPMLYEEMAELLSELDDQHEHITVTEEGRSVEGRKILLVKISHQDSEQPWRVLALGAQHGNEHSGKDALITIIEEIAEKPELLPKGTEFYFFPMVNPDGVNADNRRNGNDADLNRDHQVLAQPETQAIHRVQQRIKAHVVIDCHEFTRDSSYYTEVGFKKYPLITLGTVNNPLIHPRIQAAAEMRFDAARSFFSANQITFDEYLVGGPPPYWELRPSFQEPDDARNGLSAHQSIGFIIEAGIFRGNDNPQSDFVSRVKAYRDLLWLLMKSEREGEKEMIQEIRHQPIPEYLPTNYFWGKTNYSSMTDTVTVLDAETLEKKSIETPHLARTTVIKKSVLTPEAYIISTDHSDEYRQMLDRHAIEYRVLESDQEYSVEPAILIEIEQETDKLYDRYGGRQVVERLPVQEKKFPKGSLFISTQTTSGLRASLLLEPHRVYGLYQYPEFENNASAGSELPVYRMIN